MSEIVDLVDVCDEGMDFWVNVDGHDYKIESFADHEEENRIHFGFKTKMLDNREHKLQACVDISAIHEMSEVHGIDLYDEVIGVLKAEIIEEIKRYNRKRKLNDE